MKVRKDKRAKGRQNKRANRATDEIKKVPSSSTIYRMIHEGKIGKIEKGVRARVEGERNSF